jgi:hypothetical protein
MVHGQAARRSASTPAAMIASIILTANRGSGRTRAISVARGVNPRSPETLYPTQTGRPRREQYWGGGSFGGYRYGD